MTIDIDQIKREVGDKLSRLIPHSYSYNTMLNTIDYLAARGYLVGVADGSVLVPKCLLESWVDYSCLSDYYSDARYPNLVDDTRKLIAATPKLETK